MTYDPSKLVWQQISLNPALMEHIILSPGEVSDLTVEALKHPDPAGWLSEKLTRRAHERIKAEEARKKERMERDAAFLRDVQNWPGLICNVKLQPWQHKHSQPRFGRVEADDFDAGRWIVHSTDNGPEHFKSLEELVEVWSVD